MRILVINPGSSSLKIRVLDDADGVVAEEDLPSLEGDAELAGLERFLDRAGSLDAAGIRVVHGGREFRESVRVGTGVIDRLEPLSELAPLHNPPALAALRGLGRLQPGLPLVACFDTAFHAGIPEAAAIYAIPRQWTEEWGIRRYGFHGLSHAYASRRAAEVLGRDLAHLRVVTCHLGAGASLAAVMGGVSVDTTMGFTPMEGLVMATRSGSLDPGVVLWVQRRRGLSAEEVETLLDRGSGIFALAGTADMKTVLDAAERGDDRARLTGAIYVHRLVAAIASMAASMGGVDALVFTGGVGEHAPWIRTESCARLAFLGVSIDDRLNLEWGPSSGDAVVSPAGSTVRVIVVGAREDVEIAREVRRLLTE